MKFYHVLLVVAFSDYTLAANGFGLRGTTVRKAQEDDVYYEEVVDGYLPQMLEEEEESTDVDGIPLPPSARRAQQDDVYYEETEGGYLPQMLEEEEESADEDGIPLPP